MESSNEWYWVRDKEGKQVPDQLEQVGSMNFENWGLVTPGVEGIVDG